MNPERSTELSLERQMMQEEINILLVDDRMENLISLESLLKNKEENINYILCTSGEEALKYSIKENIALILLDVQMPGIDGYEVANLLKNNTKTKSIPIVFVTAIDHELHYVIKGFEVGAIDYLFKPLNPDITKAKVRSFINLYKQQKESEQNRNLLSSVLNSSMTGVMALKAIRELGVVVDFEWVLVNEEASKLTGLSNLVGKKLLNEMPENKSNGLFDHYVQVVESGTPAQLEYQYNHNEKFFWWFITAVKWEDGLVVNISNITDRKYSEQAIKKANHDLEAAHSNLENRVKERTSELEDSQLKLKDSYETLKKVNVDLDNFIYTASHDLKAPISNIEGLIYTLTDILDDKAKKEGEVIFKMIHQSVERFKNTIKDLTDVIKAGVDNKGDVSLIEIRPLITEVTEDIKDLIQKNKANISITLEVPAITFSKKNLRSVLYNLISNAVKYSSPERIPDILIRSHASDSYVILSVRDNGLGMKKEDIPKVFGMFKRIHDHVEGTGVGMYIVKRMIENAGGKIVVDSEIDRGSEFKIYFKK